MYFQAHGVSNMTVPQAWLDMIKDKEAFMDSHCPDWKEKFHHDVDLALDFFSVMTPEEFKRALKESQ
jgi:hypothetical protein